MEPIIINTTINAPIHKVWDYFTQPENVLNWNFAHESWECTKATNQLEVGGEFHYWMQAKDKSVGFDFWGTYTEIVFPYKIFSFLGDGRKLEVIFNKIDENTTEIFERFEPEAINSLELQEQGWQNILENFKKFAEAH